MGNEYHPELRGFDSYEVRLGDELRGERASKGKSLLDVQRDLKIRAEYIDAIENADAAAFPLSGYATGYIRTYARYLDLNEDEVYRRFCAESGFARTTAVSIEPTLNRSARTAPQRRSERTAADDAVITTRFLPKDARAASLNVGAGLRSLASLAVLAALVTGLGYGGWRVLENVQRVGFAPLPNAPEVLVHAPDILAPSGDGSEGGEVRPAAVTAADAERAALAAIYAAQETVAPVIEPRDGPISSIDPERAGIYAASERLGPARAASETAGTPIFAGLGAAPPEEAVADVDVDAMADAIADTGLDEALGLVPGANGVDILATADAWVRVRDGDRKVLFTGILGPGERFTLPEGVTAPQLRAGNAGAVYIVIDGAPFGPLGDGPAVAKRVSLTPDDVRAIYPAARTLDMPQTSGAEAVAANAGDAVALKRP